MSAQPAVSSVDDLEALFDQVAATYQPTPVASTVSSVPATPAAASAKEPANEPAMDAGDDLEELFDQVAAASASARTAEPVVPAAIAVEAPASIPAEGDPHDVFHRIGSLTRSLHDALRELGYDKNVEQAVNALPDARARLAYIANLTGNAADRALGASERGKSLLDAMQSDAATLSSAWQDVYAGRQSVEAFKATADRTQAFLNSLAQRTDETNAQFLEVMMAQDFHDLTGQVINRIASVATGLEEQLVKLLLDTTPPERRSEVESAWLSGPVVDAAGRSDVVTSQGQVDDLLESLGF
jgi:chemotaxis protein CheZ